VNLGNEIRDIWASEKMFGQIFVCLSNCFCLLRLCQKSLAIIIVLMEMQLDQLQGMSAKMAANGQKF